MNLLFAHNQVLIIKSTVYRRHYANFASLHQIRVVMAFENKRNIRSNVMLEYMVIEEGNKFKFLGYTYKFSFNENLHNNKKVNSLTI